MRILAQVELVCKEEGISESELEYMVSHAAITSRSGCNRRYFGWLFRVTSDGIVSMMLPDGDVRVNEAKVPQINSRAKSVASAFRSRAS